VKLKMTNRDINGIDTPIREYEWIETPLSKFGSKCVMNKHDFCADPLCECICHRVTLELKM